MKQGKWIGIIHSQKGVIIVPDLQDFFYRPTHSFQEFIPTLRAISVILASMIAFWGFSYFLRVRKNQKLSWKRFLIQARRYAMNRQEISMLRKLAASANLANPSQLLTRQDQFERIARVIDKNGRRYEKRLIRSIREKLFGLNPLSADEMQSTDSLPPGTRLFIKYLNDPETVFWGHLVDNDRQGLIVIIPSNREIRSPLRLNTHLEITAYLPDQQPLLFVTWVKSVIPGPRKMVILGHSDFVVKVREINGNVQLIGPQRMNPGNLYLDKPVKSRIRNTFSSFVNQARQS